MNKPLDDRSIDDARDRWEREYAAQVGEDRPVVNRSGIPIQPPATESTARSMSGTVIEKGDSCTCFSTCGSMREAPKKVMKIRRLM